MSYQKFMLPVINNQSTILAPIYIRWNLFNFGCNYNKVNSVSTRIPTWPFDQITWDELKTNSFSLIESRRPNPGRYIIHKFYSHGVICMWCMLIKMIVKMKRWPLETSHNYPVYSRLRSVFCVKLGRSLFSSSHCVFDELHEQTDFPRFFDIQ